MVKCQLFLHILKFFIKILWLSAGSGDFLTSSHFSKEVMLSASKETSLLVGLSSQRNDQNYRIMTHFIRLLKFVNCDTRELSEQCRQDLIICFLEMCQPLQLYYHQLNPMTMNDHLGRWTCVWQSLISLDLIAFKVDTCFYLCYI